MTRVAHFAVALAALIALSSCSLQRHDAAARVPPIDLNSASLRAVERLPGVTPSMARRIVDGRPYAAPEDLVERGILTSRELDRVGDRVTVRELR
jgi:DNA uptake protein ComE-like DNA-binding protein